MKKLSFIISILCLCALVFGLVACDSNHTHTPSDKWSSDNLSHWHICTDENCPDKEAKIDEATHTFGEWTPVSAAACGTPGTEKRTCSVCGYEETRDTAALSHAFGSWATKTEANCKDKEVQTRTCSKCGTEETREIGEVDPDNHKGITEDMWKETTAGTCSAEAVLTATCTACEQTATKKGEKNPDNHDHGLDNAEWTVKTPGDCVTEAVLKATCANCQKEVTKKGEKDMTNHTGIPDASDPSWGEPTTTANCSTGNIYTTKCTACQQDVTREDDERNADVHVYDEENGWTGVEGQAPTCTFAGKEEIFCTLCEGGRKERDGEINPENHGNGLDNAVWTVKTPGTCVNGVVEMTTCKNCKKEVTRVGATNPDNHVKKPAIPALDGSGYAGWKTAATTNGWTVKDGNCSEEALLSWQCPDCNNTVDNVKGQKDPDNHGDGIDNEVWVIDPNDKPTCVKDGTRYHVCKYCEAHTSGVPAPHDPTKKEYHSYTKVTTREANCETKAEYTYTCTLCQGDEPNNNLHSYTEEGEVDKEKHILDYEKAEQDLKGHKIPYKCKDMTGEFVEGAHTFNTPNESDSEEGQGDTCTVCQYQLKNRENAPGKGVKYGKDAGVDAKNKNPWQVNSADTSAQDELIIIPYVNEGYRITEIAYTDGSSYTFFLSSNIKATGLVIPHTIETFVNIQDYKPGVQAISQQSLFGKDIPSGLLRIFYEGTKEEFLKIDGVTESGIFATCGEKIVYYSESGEPGTWKWSEDGAQPIVANFPGNNYVGAVNTTYGLTYSDTTVTGATLADNVYTVFVNKNDAGQPIATINANVFANTKADSFVLAASVRTIGNNAFPSGSKVYYEGGESGLTNLNLPDSVTGYYYSATDPGSTSYNTWHYTLDKYGFLTTPTVWHEKAEEFPDPADHDYQQKEGGVFDMTNLNKNLIGSFKTGTIYNTNYFGITDVTTRFSKVKDYLVIIPAKIDGKTIEAVRRTAMYDGNDNTVTAHIVVPNTLKYMGPDGTYTNYGIVNTSIKFVTFYFEGLESQYNEMIKLPDIQSVRFKQDSKVLSDVAAKSAVKFYSYSKPSSNHDKYWHWVGNKPTLWSES